MTVTMTSEAYGKLPGETYTGPQEAWLLANGYASQGGYTGPGVSDTGAMDVAPGSDPQLAENREAPKWPTYVSHETGFANDAAGLAGTKFPNPDLDFDANGVDDDAPEGAVLTPNEGPAAGGTVVHINGDNIEGVTSVTFGGTAGTSLTVDDNQNLHVTTAAHAAGVVNVVLVDAAGNETVVGGFTYTA